MANLGYVAAAYAVVLLTLGGYALALIRRERALRRELATTVPPRPRGSG